MSSRRPVILMGTLLAMLLGYMSQSTWFPWLFGGDDQRRPDLAPLKGNDTVSGLKVIEGKNGVWTASFDYFYTGARPHASLQYELIPTTGNQYPLTPLQQWKDSIGQAQRGEHHVYVRLDYRGRGPGVVRTQQVAVILRSAEGDQGVIAKQQIDKIIDWPDFQTWARDQLLAGKSRDENYKRAVALIDSEDPRQMNEAGAILEGLLRQDVNYDPAYVQIARIVLKSDGGPQGLHQAESLLHSALQLRPDNADAKVLLAHVYTHQRHFAKAETLYVEVAESKTNNPWLWTNWGESLEMQNRTDQAIAKYRKAIACPRTFNTYDRGRLGAYDLLLRLLAHRNDLDGMEALYKQRVAEYGPSSCYTSDYARFLLRERGDIQGAIDLARGALNRECDDSASRKVLGQALYVKWSTTKGPERLESLNQARIFLPAGPMPLYLLVLSDRTAFAAKQLIAAGEEVDQKDNDKMTALAFALQNREFAAAKRLLALGANWNTLVGYEGVPVALIPVMSGDIEAVRTLRTAGVDYSSLHFRGVTAVDIARQSGNKAMLELLGGGESAL